MSRGAGTVDVRSRFERGCWTRRSGAGGSDHGVPRRPRAELLVLAHSSCNNAKSDHLAAEQHLSACRGNRTHPGRTASPVADAALPCDLPAAVQIARWVYHQTQEANGQVWVAEGRAPTPRSHLVAVLRGVTDGRAWSGGFRDMIDLATETVLTTLHLPVRRPSGLVDRFHLTASPGTPVSVFASTRRPTRGRADCRGGGRRRWVGGSARAARRPGRRGFVAVPDSPRWESKAARGGRPSESRCSRSKAVVPATVDAFQATQF